MHAPIHIIVESDVFATTRLQGEGDPRGPGRWHDREVAADHLVGRRGKARDFASLASFASLIASNRCQQMICVGDAKLETARGLRHRFCVCVTRSSRLYRSRLVS
jgi:hypothetical protein